MDDLIKKEGWKVVGVTPNQKIIAYGYEFPYTHPFRINAKLYREQKNPDRRYLHMKAMHDYLWPDTTWHYWTERRFKAHCEGWNYISYAGGASCSKSYDAAKIALLFWLGNPKHRAVVVASTTLDSLNTRIFGYLLKHLNSSVLKIPHNYLSSSPPKILISKTDKIHGIFAVSAKKGDDDNSIKDIIGRHPDEGIMLILDEGTDMPPALTKALPNLEQGVEIFQAMVIGNSSDKFDLHGALSTPKNGWDSIDYMRDNRWLTTQKNGICLYFNPYESPAIFEKDPKRKEKLSKFLITKEQIEDKKKVLGENTSAFFRFVLGFWNTKGSDDTVISQKFLEEFNVDIKTEWAGEYPIKIVAGLDPAFSAGGDSCILRLGKLGVDIGGNVVLDYEKEKLLFKIPLMPMVNKSAELQIADRVLEILGQYGVALRDLCIDANGAGRGLGEVIKLRANSVWSPIRIYSTRHTGGVSKSTSFDVHIKSPYDLWFDVKPYMQKRQIRGLDSITIAQLSSRKVIFKAGKPTLETKVDYRNRMGAIMPSLARSPDEADASMLCLQAAILNHGFIPGQVKETVRLNDWVDNKYWTHKEELKVVEQQHVEIGQGFSGQLEDIGIYKPRFT